MISPSELAVTVAALMHFYGLTNTEPEIRQAQFEMFWLPELREFEAAIVRQACREWQGRPVKEAPTAGQIRAACVELRKNAAWRADRALPKPEAMPEAEMIEIADAWAQRHGFASMLDMQRSPDFRGASIKIGPKQWHRFEPIREAEPPIIVAPVQRQKAEPAAKREPPQWIVERDQQRAEARRQEMGIDRINAAVDHYLDAQNAAPAIDIAEAAA